MGKDYVLAMHNQGVHIQTRSGETRYTNSLRGFWTHANIGAYSTILDPRVVYDPFHDRWIATATIDFTSINSAVVVAVLTTSNPTNHHDWKFTRVKADTNSLLWADQPIIGFNKDWIVVQANMAPLEGSGFVASYLFVFNKADFHDPDADPPPVMRPFHNDPDYGGSERPAVNRVLAGEIE